MYQQTVKSPRNEYVRPVVSAHRPVASILCADDELAEYLAGDEETQHPEVPATLALGYRLARHLLTIGPVVLSDMLALLLAGSLGLLVVRLTGMKLPAHLGAAMPLALMPLVLTYLIGGLYRAVGPHPAVELRLIARTTTTTFIGLFAAAFFTAFSHTWRAFFPVAWIGSMILVPVLRALVREWCSKQHWWGHPVIIVSSGDALATVVDMVLESPSSGLRAVGVIDPTLSCRGNVRGLPLANHPSSARGLIRREGVQYAVVALPEMSQADVLQVMERYAARIPRVLMISNFNDMPTLWRDTHGFGGLNGIELHNKLALMTPRVIKRSTDVAATLFGGMLILPLLLAIAAAVKLTSRGSIFYGHKRLGLGGLPFKAWKFRTMVSNGDEVLARYLAQNPAARAEWEQDHKLRDDPRVTWVGKFLRKCSLDELPQLWNVLRGEMSLVGPRPIIDAEIEKYGNVYKLYKDVKPGITGLWQVSGRNDTTYGQRVQLDSFYVRNWSPWLDLNILGRTVLTLVRREGAY